ncbi:DExH-box ATP-dependent RNA helicase DExH14 isoform X2 [Prunus yedoensis var. nudiflora]|uniref:DExH-box ATP-dependent RNA helicase DExH14 isoform X2 n=1 Tax=Prunus yedoensis var. nudiflora TaxID=2094558 RepID=A0A314U7I0_PRUYE|nr:DExH-box ATP-dependent RNA helicase DExH14 isoform X2 [Prunus yedoensis var. nudiflora]
MEKLSFLFMNPKRASIKRLVQNTFEDLEDSGCIKMNEDNVEPTMLGSIASQYYLGYMTVSMFGSNIGSDTSLEVFLHILSAASEYNELPVRHNEDLQPFPRIEVKLKLQQKDSGKSRSLDIRLVKTNFRQNKSRAFTPRFPKVKNEAWWLVLGNTSTWELYALKRVSFSDHLVTHMELPSAPNTLQGMKFTLISDCYLGFEQEHSISELVQRQ